MRWMKTKIEYISFDYVTPGSKPNSTNYQMCNDGKITVKFLYIPLLSSINYVQLDLKLWSTNSFLNIYFICIFVCECFACIYVFELSVWLVPIETRRVCWVPWKWNYGKLWAIIWVLRTKLESPSGAACSLNFWANSLVPDPLILNCVICFKLCSWIRLHPAL